MTSRRSPSRRPPRSPRDVVALVIAWILVLGGLAFAAFVVLLMWGISQWGSNK